MKVTKLLLIFLLFMLTAAVKCGGGGGGFPTGPTSCGPPGYPNGQCGWPTFSSFEVLFNDGTRRTYATGINGCIRWSPRNNDCGILIRYPSSFGFSLVANPGSVNLQAPPASGTISGPGGISTANGMPTVEYYDQYGYFIGGVTAVTVGGDGTWLEAPQPDMSNIYSGSYTVVTANADGQTVGIAYMDAWGRDRPDSDGDGWYDDEDCYPYDPSRSSCYEPGGCDNQQYDRYEVQPIQEPCYVY